MHVLLHAPLLTACGGDPEAPLPATGEAHWTFDTGRFVSDHLEPVQSAGLIFVRSQASPSSFNHHRLHAIDLTTGEERWHSDRTALDHLARRHMWWADPEEARDQRDLLLAQLMQLGTWDDVQRARELFGDDAFRQALRNAPAGVLDARSWNYWHLFYGIEPVPPMPERPLP